MRSDHGPRDGQLTGLAAYKKYHFLVTVRDGKIIEVKEYFDLMHTVELLASFS